MKGFSQESGVLRILTGARHSGGRLGRLILAHAVLYVQLRPFLKENIALVLARFPSARGRLARHIAVARTNGALGVLPDTVESYDRLTARGRAIYADLAHARHDITG